MKGGFDYDVVADLYDALVPIEADIPFFLEEASRARGRVLELMAGTGRVSLPLLDAGVPLTCMDRSRRMLERLRAKLAAADLSGCAVRADVCDLPFARCFSMALIPFNSFGELVEVDDQLTALEAIRQTLLPSGTFLCTLHNPPVRLRTVDGTLRTIRRLPHPAGGGEVVLRLQLAYDERTASASGVQIVEERTSDGGLQRERRMEIRFALPTRSEFEERCRSAGFTIERMYGDYDRSAYQEDTSPYMIWLLRRS